MDPNVRKGSSGQADATISIGDMPAVAAEASLDLLHELVSILGTDLVSAWLHGGTTFPDRPVVPGDLDLCVLVETVTPGERTPITWRHDPGSRPSRIYAAEAVVAGRLGVKFDTSYLVTAEMMGAEPPRSAFNEDESDPSWPVYRAHWLAGQYVHLHGARPEALVGPPTNEELRGSLVSELEHLERHVLAGDAEDPYEAAYAIHNGCRILYTVATRSPVVSKRSAGRWGLQNLPARWSEVIRAASRSYDGCPNATDHQRLRADMAGFVALVRKRVNASRSDSDPGT